MDYRKFLKLKLSARPNPYKVTLDHMTIGIITRLMKMLSKVQPISFCPSKVETVMLVLGSIAQEPDVLNGRKVARVLLKTSEPTEHRNFFLL